MSDQVCCFPTNDQTIMIVERYVYIGDSKDYLPFFKPVRMPRRSIILRNKQKDNSPSASHLLYAHMLEKYSFFGVIKATPSSSIISTRRVSSTKCFHLKLLLLGRRRMWVDIEQDVSSIVGWKKSTWLEAGNISFENVWIVVRKTTARQSKDYWKASAWTGCQISK